MTQRKAASKKTDLFLSRIRGLSIQVAFFQTSDVLGSKIVSYIACARTDNPAGTKRVGQVACTRINNPPRTKIVGQTARIKIKSLLSIIIVSSTGVNHLASLMQDRTQRWLNPILQKMIIKGDIFWYHAS